MDRRGVGRSTVSRILANRWDGTINISGDALRHFAPANARDHLGAGSTYRAGAALVASYMQMGARRTYSITSSNGRRT